MTDGLRETNLTKRFAEHFNAKSLSRHTTFEFKEPHSRTRSRRNEIILLIIIATVLIVGGFPTPHLRVREDLVETLDCTTNLVDGGSLVDAWSGMQDQTKIIIDIHSSEDVNVRLSAVISTDIYQAVLLYDQVRRVHSITFTRSDPGYEMTVYNQPAGWFGNRVTADMTGSIRAFHVYEETEWLPWWLP